MDASDPSRRIADNPFHVLGLEPDCSRAEVEREGQKLLGMLAIGLSAARTYDTPLGALPRTAEAVREAIARGDTPALRPIVEKLWRLLPADAKTRRLSFDSGVR